MKQFVPLLAAGFLGALFASTAIYWEMRTEVAQAADPSPAGPTQRVLFQVDGISCGSCEAKIRKALEPKPGVTAVAVSLDDRTVTVEYQEGVADPKALADAITRAGYPAHFVASGPSVPALPKAKAAKGGGCGGACCAGKS